MFEPDPQVITSQVWEDISVVINYLLVFVGALIAVAASFLLAHIAIPSLVTTGHVPQSFNRIRIVFYASLGASAAVVVYVALLFFRDIGFLHDFYPKWLI